MSEKVVLVSDAGIDGAFAVALALFDPKLEVLGLAATAGNVHAEQATHNIHVLIEQLDPPRWPRLGASPAIEFVRERRASSSSRTAWAIPTFPASRCIIRRPATNSSSTWCVPSA